MNSVRCSLSPHPAVTCSFCRNATLFSSCSFTEPTLAGPRDIYTHLIHPWMDVWLPVVHNVKVCFQLTCVRSLVDLKVLTPCEHFSATWKRTLERPFSGVHSDVVDKLVLGLERSSVASTAQPATGVVRLFGTTHVLDSQVHDCVLYAGERATARARSGGRLSLDAGRRPARTSLIAGHSTCCPQTSQRLLRLDRRRAGCG